MSNESLRFRKNLEKMFIGEANIKIRFYDFETLKRQFGINENTPPNNLYTK